MCQPYIESKIIMKKTQETTFLADARNGEGYFSLILSSSLFYIVCFLFVVVCLFS